MAPTADCRYGVSCTRPGCTFKHPLVKQTLEPAWIVCGKFAEKRCRDYNTCTGTTDGTTDGRSRLPLGEE